MKGRLSRELPISPGLVIEAEDLEELARKMVGKPVMGDGAEIGKIISAVVVGDYIEWGGFLMSESIKQRSREALRLRILRGTEEEVWPAFEELMRRNMEGVSEEGPDIWNEKPNFSDFGSVGWEEYLDELNRWLEKVKARLDDLKNDCDGFLKLASESTLRGAANRKKLEAVKARCEIILKTQNRTNLWYLCDDILKIIEGAS